MPNKRSESARPWVFPVIHVHTLALTLANAAQAFEAGCDGVFLISMDGHDEVLEAMALAVKKAYPGMRVGINYLSLPATVAIERCAGAGLDMTWSDNAQVHSAQSQEKALEISSVLAKYRANHQFFGGVAFKYQTYEPEPEVAAVRASGFGFIPTTSGPGTGHAAEVSKVKAMHEALCGRDLAIASGITPENVLEFAPYLSHILVASGVSTDEHHFDFEKLCRLMGQLTKGKA